eukprot:TRINITY_DN23695_c0_g1_i1.p1 TRINITY_DN23695_c0_g1~~TRINITY_DN23695_c0_g1_i1.p1  ORF type:complete len:207 (-),score=57.50 TRINITY_DN23695_c0_g1_i1:277-897(-)
MTSTEHSADRRVSNNEDSGDGDVRSGGLTSEGADTAEGGGDEEEDELGEWHKTREELEVLDRLIVELREELRQFESRREAILKRKDDLQQQAGDACVQLASLEIPKPAELKVFEISCKEDAPGEEATPTAEVVTTSSAAAAENPPLAPAKAAVGEDWERGLDSFGVAKCGVCGLKFPLDVKEIEKHCLECEESQRPRASSLNTPRG